MDASVYFRLGGRGMSLREKSVVFRWVSVDVSVVNLIQHPVIQISPMRDSQHGVENLLGKANAVGLCALRSYLL